MGYRLSKIVTKTGDNGTTQVEAGKRIPKDSPRVQALGDIDELNSAIGIVLAYPIQQETIRTALQRIQQDLFHLGGELCPPHRPAITEAAIHLLDNHVSTWNDTLPPLKEFLLPGGNVTSAHCHLARTICRRAERSLVRLHHAEPIAPTLLTYMNRLSDVLFIFARVLAQETRSAEILWEHDRKK